MQVRPRSTLMLIALALCAGCTAVPGTEPVGVVGTVARLIQENGDLATMETALEAAGLTPTLESAGPYTVFAPNNSAFAALPAGTVEALLAGEKRDVLTDLLNVHIVAGEYEGLDFRDGQTLKTLEGIDLAVSVEYGEVRVNGVAIRTTDLKATNGVVHVIDGVLTTGLDAMQMAAVIPNLSKLVSALRVAGLDSSIGGNTLVTLFAPMDAAFAKLDPGFVDRMLLPANRPLLQKILTYHMLPGRYLAAQMPEGGTIVTVQGQPVYFVVRFGRKVNVANIVTTDIRVSNGVIHLIDAVLQEHLDLLDVARLQGFESFAAAVQSAGDPGLTSALRHGTFTVFAPTNAAFEAAAAATPGDPAALADLLRYHIAVGRLGAGALTNGLKLKTLRGDSLTVQNSGAGLSIMGERNGATLSRELGAVNGVIHGINAIILPPS